MDAHPSSVHLTSIIGSEVAPRLAASFGLVSVATIVPLGIAEPNRWQPSGGLA
jgi:hypothetical protein